MTTPLFTPGQEVICLVANWVMTYPMVATPGYATPQKNEVYEVLKCENHHNKWYVSLTQFGEEFGFVQENFAPVMPDGDLEELIAEIFHQPITII